MQGNALLIGNIFLNAARACPDRVAAALGDDLLTFGDLEVRANRCAHALQNRGIGHGDVVVVWSDTTLAAVPVFAALAKLGAVFAPVQGALSDDEAAPILAVAKPALLISDRPRHGAIRFEDLDSDDSSKVGCPDLEEDDPHVVFFTSGSTGAPKGAVISHRVNVLRSHPGALLEARGAMVCPYPLFHMGAWTIALQQWQARDRVVFLERADAAAIVDAIERHNATRINCIPGVWRRVLAHLEKDLDARTLRGLRFADTGTSATPPELLDAIRAACPNAQVRVFYGSTEAGSVASLAHDDLSRKPGSCGVPAPLSEVMLAEDGELLVRGPLVFGGYVGGEDAFAAGWYGTGDLADIDGEGYLTIVGRARDVIRTGGETVAPTEVEVVIAGHPTIADVAVIGLPDAEWGEVVCAVVVPRPEKDAPSIDELRAFCESKLARHKQPRRVVAVESIPRTAATNQVQRRLLVERIAGIM